MAWVILCFALVGPVVGSIVYVFVSRLGPALSEHMPENEHANAIVTFLIESVIAGAYGVIFMIPMTGTLGAIAGLIYWLLLKNRKLGNGVLQVAQCLGVGAYLGYPKRSAVGVSLPNTTSSTDKVFIFSHADAKTFEHVITRSKADLASPPGKRQKLSHSVTGCPAGQSGKQALA